MYCTRDDRVRAEIRKYVSRNKKKNICKAIDNCIAHCHPLVFVSESTFSRRTVSRSLHKHRCSAVCEHTKVRRHATCRQKGLVKPLRCRRLSTSVDAFMVVAAGLPRDNAHSIVLHAEQTSASHCNAPQKYCGGQHRNDGCQQYPANNHQDCVADRLFNWVSHQWIESFI